MSDECQKPSTRAACPLARTTPSALITITIHEATDIKTSAANTQRVTQSPWAHTCIKPNPLLSISLHSNTKLIGTLNHIASGTPLRVPGT